MIKNFGGGGLGDEGDHGTDVLTDLVDFHQLREGVTDTKVLFPVSSEHLKQLDPELVFVHKEVIFTFGTGI